MEQAAAFPLVGDSQDVAITRMVRRLLDLLRLYGDCAAEVLAISEDPRGLDTILLQMTKARYDLVGLHRQLTDCSAGLLGLRQDRTATAFPRPISLAEGA